jgi:glycerol-3-phosphate acyltransferase PlsX
MDNKIRIAVDAMGGDGSPKKIIDGISDHNKKSKNIHYLIFGDKDIISKYIPNSLTENFFEIIDTKNFVQGKDTPLEAAKRGKDTSMWLSIESVKQKKADIVISAGNTGALLVISKLNLKMIENIDKPALSALWPNKIGMSVVLDLGANIECNEKNLIDFSIMGASIFKSLYPDEKAKVALLNIGSEEVKGNEILKNTYQKISKNKNFDFDFKGFIEGNELMNGDVNVIVSDGFTGNVALKTAEGTANFITNELRKVFKDNFFGKLSGIVNYFNLKKFKKRLDPRLYNGAIFIGLDSPVVKSHGATDYIGFSNSLSVCEKIIKGDLINKIKKNIYREN